MIEFARSIFNRYAQLSLALASHLVISLSQFVVATKVWTSHGLWGGNSCVLFATSREATASTTNVAQHVVRLRWAAMRRRQGGARPFDIIIDMRLACRDNPGNFVGLRVISSTQLGSRRHGKLSKLDLNQRINWMLSTWLGESERWIKSIGCKNSSKLNYVLNCIICINQAMITYLYNKT